jgi:antitoxin ParD1/3/4
MTTLQISLPDPIGKLIDDAVKSGQFRSADEYIQHLIREDQLPFEPDWAEQAVLEGLKSGPGIAPDDAWWERQRAALVRRHSGTERE